MIARLAERSSDVGLLRRALPPCVLFAIALAVRVLPWPTVLDGNRVVFFGMDSWYHMRRILFALVNSGWPPEFDAYVNFPEGAKPIWSPLFDALAAWLLQPVYALGGVLAVERAAALLPPLLGSLCVVVLYLLGRRLFGEAVAAVAGLLLCFLSGHFWYSQIGFVDHHVAVALTSTMLLAASMKLLSASDSTQAARAGSWRRYAGTGALAAILLLLWPGSLIHVGIVELALLVFLASRPGRSQATGAAIGLVLLYGVAFVGVAPLGFASDWPQWSEYSPAVVSRFQPWMFAALALHAAACAMLWRSTRFGESRLARAAQVGGIGAAVLGLSLLAFPDLLAGATDAWRWLAKEEEFQELVKESKPLFYGRDGFSVANAERRLSRFIWVFPFSLVALVWHARASRLRPSLLLLLLWACVLAGATLLQRRFFNSFTPAFALVIAWTCVEAARRLPDPLVGTPLRRRLCGALAALGALWMLAPSLTAYLLPLSNVIRHAQGAPLSLHPLDRSRRVLLEAAEWLRANTPPTSGYLDPEAAPEYGVLAPWGYGHLLKYVARRPTAVGNFGDDVGAGNLWRVDVYFLNGEQQAIWALERLKARYVLLRTLGDVAPERLRGEAMRGRLSVDDSPGLAHHRLIYESPLGRARAEIGRSEIRIFEYVLGADVSGSAPAGAQVRATLQYQSNRGRSGRYRTSAQADAQGRYQLRLPYSTRAAPPGVATEAAYRLRSGGSTVLLEIDEAQVRNGLAVEGPSFPTE